MRIGELAKKAGVGVETVRFYEKKGLLDQPPRPAAGGFRSYPTEAVSRIRFIRHAQDLGFTLREAGELLALKADPSFDCADVRKRAQGKRQEVELKIERLAKIRDSLDQLIACCPEQGSVTSCSIIGALERSDSRGKSSQQMRKVRTMSEKRRIEIFSADCPVCRSAIERVQEIACPSCEIAILDMRDDQIADRAEILGIRSIPAVVIDGQLADCCAGGGIDESTLKAAGVGQPIR